MTSEIRANKQTNRAGLGTVTYADTGIIVSGIVTCTELSGLTALNIAGVGTASTLDINGDIDVDGHTNLDNLSIAGVTTFSGNIGGTATFQDIDVDGHTNLDNVSIAGVTTMSGNLTISNTDPQLTIHDTNHNPSHYYLKGVGGAFKITDSTNGDRISFNSNGSISVTASLFNIVGAAQVSSNLGVTGNLTPSGTLYLTDAIEHTDDSNTKIRFPAADTITAETAGTERLRITSTGLIRMGNGAEANTEASITAAIFQNVTGTATILKLGNTNTPSSANNRAIEFCDGTGGTEGSSKYTYASIKAERTGGSNAGRLILSTKPDNSSGPSEALRITSTGNVGINQTSPQRILHVGESGTAEANIRIQGGADYGEIRSKDSDQALTFHYNIGGAGSRELFSSNGSTGHFSINCYSYQALTITTNENGTNGPEIQLMHNSASPAANDIVGQIRYSGKDSAGNTELYSKIETKATTVTSGSETGHVDFSTRGGGAYNSMFRLSARGTASAPSYTTDDMNGIILDTYNTGNPYPRYFNFIAKSAGNTDSNIGFWTEAVGGSPTEKLRITSDGQIRKAQGANVTSLKTYNSNSDAFWLDHYQYQVSSTYQRYTDIVSIGDGTWGSNIRFFTNANGSANGIERLRIASTGNVSIGTQNVTEGKLQVNGDITAGIQHGSSGIYGMLAGRKFDGTSALGGYAIRYGSGYESPWIVGYNAGSGYDNQITFGSLTTSDRSLATGVTKRMVIDMYDGNVGISSASPVEKLDVAGSINAGGENAPVLKIHSEQGNLVKSFKHYFDVFKGASTGNAANRTIVAITMNENFHQAIFEITYGTRLQAVSDQHTRPNKVIFGVNRFNGASSVDVTKTVVEQHSEAASHCDANVVTVSSTVYHLQLEFGTQPHVSSGAGGWVEGTTIIGATFHDVNVYYGVRD